MNKILYFDLLEKLLVAIVQLLLEILRNESKDRKD